MIIDSKSALIKNRKLQFLMPILVIVGIGLAYSDDILYYIKYPYPSNSIIWFFLTIYLLFILYSFIKNEYYFYFSDNNDFITIRYYKLKLLNLNSSHQQILIAKNQLHKYEIKKSFFNIRKQILIYQLKNSKIAKYPPISISILKKNDLKLLETTLKQYINNKTS